MFVESSLSKQNFNPFIFTAYKLPNLSIHL